MTYQATDESIRAHTAPNWFHDAKLGIFIHWGLYSVPGYAPYSDTDIMTLFKQQGFAAMRQNPYAEWYLNTLQFKDYPTWQYHVEHYGADFAYADFQPKFEEASAQMDATDWASLFTKIGAKYAVLTTKHHDGYLLWPSRHPNTRVGAYQSKRDLVGDITEATRAAGLKMGLYYSGVLDWTYLHYPTDSLYTFMLNRGQQSEYTEYANKHVVELIDRYKPDILWNDIGYPAGTDTNALFAHYYNSVPHGLVNDRWTQLDVPQDEAGRAALKSQLAAQEGSVDMVFEAPDCHYDFRTPEYVVYPDIQQEKFEVCRGIGMSFGYNRLEDEQNTLTAAELIYSFVDTVSKNGNLLIGVGPRADGSIPEYQQKPLLEFGKWLEVNGEALFGTRPWQRAEGTTHEDHDVRFTQKEGNVYAVVLGQPTSMQVTLNNMNPARQVRLLGQHDACPTHHHDGNLIIDLPAELPNTPALSFEIRV
ncbi:MAG: alpha-L-fucosidase [Deinococcota bacterium]